MIHFSAKVYSKITYLQLPDWNKSLNVCCSIVSWQKSISNSYLPVVAVQVCKCILGYRSLLLPGLLSRPDEGCVKQLLISVHARLDQHITSKCVTHDCFPLKANWVSISQLKGKKNKKVLLKFVIVPNFCSHLPCLTERCCRDAAEQGNSFPNLPNAAIHPSHFYSLLWFTSCLYGCFVSPTWLTEMTFCLIEDGMSSSVIHAAAWRRQRGAWIMPWIISPIVNSDKDFMYIHPSTCVGTDYTSSRFKYLPQSWQNMDVYHLHPSPIPILVY